MNLTLDTLNIFLNDKITDINRQCSSVTKRGFCGHINIGIIFKDIINNFNLEQIKISEEPKIDIYKSVNNMYIKRLCICDKPCSDDNKCFTSKSKLNCDGHHVILLSSRNDNTIDMENDYVIDFTYKQMLISMDEEKNAQKINEIKNLPTYLFLKLKDYSTYSTSSRWFTNITNPCWVIVNNEDNLSGGYYKKYLKYKQKYLKLKNNK